MEPKNVVKNVGNEDNGAGDALTVFATVEAAKANKPTGKGADRKRLYHIVIRKEHVGERFAYAPNPQIAAGVVCQDLGVGIAAVDTVSVDSLASKIGTLSADDRKRLLDMLKKS